MVALGASGVAVGLFGAHSHTSAASASAACDAPSTSSAKPSSGRPPRHRPQDRAALRGQHPVHRVGGDRHDGRRPPAAGTSWR